MNKNICLYLVVGASILAGSLFFLFIRNVNKHCCKKKSSPIETPVRRNKTTSPVRPEGSSAAAYLKDKGDQNKESNTMSQITFAMIKPDAVEAKNAGKIIDLIEKNGFDILRLEKIQLSKDLAEEFYAVHKERPFFGELVEFVTSGPVIIMALEKENAVQAWRDLMGATNPANAAEGTVRKLYAQSIGKNAAHGSDAPETAVQELDLFFGNESCDDEACDDDSCNE